VRRLAVVTALLALVPVPAGGQGSNAAHRAAVDVARFGPRPAAGAAERRAHRWVAARFRRAGLAVTYTRFGVPGKGRSRNVIGAFRGRQRCLKIVMAHTDSVPDGPGAIDNASGVGVVVALASRLRDINPVCDIWLVATGAEERPYTGTPDHLGASALVRYVRRRGMASRLRYALSLDMVGRGRRFWLRSPRPGPRPRVEGEVVAAGRRQSVRIAWVRDSGQGNSDHREFDLAGLPGMVIQVWRGADACYHTACDRPGRLQAGALDRVQRVTESLLRRG
jgi:Iap family predicted aminopeptidase